MISSLTIDRVNDLDLIAVIEKYTPLKKSGSTFTGKSPFTDEKTGSFHVSPAKNVWKCFSTGKGGNSAVKFVMEFQKCTYPEAIKELAEKFNIPIEYDSSERSEKYQEKRQKMLAITEVNSLAHEFFTLPENLALIPLDKRRATPEMYEKFSIGFAPNDFQALIHFLRSKGVSEEMMIKSSLAKKSEKGGIYSFFRGRIMFPVFDHSGKLVGFSGRNIIEETEGKSIPKVLNSSETDAYSKSHSLLGIHLAKESMLKMGFAVKVEGNFDLTSVHQIGYTNAIAPLGTAFTTDQMEIIAKFTNKILLIPDNDKAARKYLFSDTQNLLEKGFQVQLFFPPNEGQDPDDFIQSIEPAQHLKLFKNIEENKIDAVEWLAMQLFSKAKDVPSRNMAEDDVSSLIAAIPDVSLRNAYVKSLAKNYKLERADVEKKVKVAVAKKLTDEDEEVDGYVLPRHLSKDELQDFAEFGFYKETDPKRIGYYFPRGNSFRDFDRITNFIIKPIFQVESKDDSKRIVEIQNPFKKVIIEITNKAFHSLQAFKECVGNYGNFYFRGTAFQHQSLIIKLMAHFPFCHEIRTLGWQKSGNFMAFADGIIDENRFKKIDPFGVVEKNDVKYFLPAFSDLNSKLDDEDDYYEADRFFRYRPNPQIDLNKWSKKMQRVYDVNGKWAVLYFIACNFRDIIFSYEQIFPILFGTGQPGTGKSTCARSVSTIFTADQPAFNLSTGTAVGFQRRLARTRNTMVWMDEYRNDIDEKRFQALKGGFDGTGAEKGVMSNDNRTKSTKINSGYFITGQHFPTRDENALLLRCILLQFERKQEDLSEIDIAEYEELSKWQMGGLSNLILECLAYRDFVKDNWSTYYQQNVRKMKRELQSVEYEGRTMQSFTILLTCLELLGDKLNLAMNFNETFDLGVKFIINQSEISADSNVLNTFWKMLEFLSFDMILRNLEDYKVEAITSISVRGKTKKDETIIFPNGQRKNVLFIRFQRVFPKYAEHHRKQTGENGHAETSLKAYMKSDKAFLGNVGITDFNGQKTSAYAFDFDRLGISLKDVIIEKQAPTINQSNLFEMKQNDDMPF